MKRHIILAVTIALGAMVGCKTKQATGTANTNSGPPTVVYKTKADYSQYVPVTLSADKSQIVAYPAIADIYYKGKLAVPVQLNKGYWLDNRGIGPNSAFLELTYEEYKNLKEVPRLDDLYKRIKDNDPFTEIYNLGDRNRFKNEVEEINQIISKGGLKKFTRLK